ncbi:MAG: hypothetical protein ACJ77B_07495 [Chloroflexota bacterium]
MATTDARTGFRLPWSSDQRPTGDDSVAESSAPDGETSAAEMASSTGDAAIAAAGEASTMSQAEPEQTAASYDDGSVAAAPPPSGGRKPAGGRGPSKFMADLTKAMQAAAESAREESFARLQADAKTAIEEIRSRAATDSADLRRTADDDVAGIREWSKAEIARIREETDQKIAARKSQLEVEIEEHGASIERRVERVNSRITAYEADMARFFERLLGEEDPSRFASLAENLPEPPSLDELDGSPATAWTPPTPEAPVAERAPEPIAEAVVDSATEPTPSFNGTESAMAAIEAVARAADTDGHNGSSSESHELVGETVVEAAPADAAADDPRLAALAMSPDFAAAEAEAAAAAGASDAAEEIPTIGDDALAARLAGLVPPTAEDGASAAQPKATQVVVVGLVSVASIASFKRHLGRLPGVQSVGVSSGPDGEFVFAVNHGAEVSLRDAIPSLPGFHAKVTDGDDSSIQVTARDPESEA